MYYFIRSERLNNNVELNTLLNCIFILYFKSDIIGWYSASRKYHPSLYSAIRTYFFRYDNENSSKSHSNQSDLQNNIPVNVTPTISRKSTITSDCNKSYLCIKVNFISKMTKWYRYKVGNDTYYPWIFIVTGRILVVRISKLSTWKDIVMVGEKVWKENDVNIILWKKKNSKMDNEIQKS